MSNAEIAFPIKGINKNWANSNQPPQTSPDMNNVRPYGTDEVRLRGGQRPGLNNQYSARIDTPNNPIVELLSVTFV